jgi:hypothetical protein
MISSRVRHNTLVLALFLVHYLRMMIYWAIQADLRETVGYTPVPRCRSMILISKPLTGTREYPAIKHFREPGAARDGGPGIAFVVSYTVLTDSTRRRVAPNYPSAVDAGGVGSSG